MLINEGTNGIMKFIKILFCGEKEMRINKLEISGIGGIKQLTLNFTPQLNVICGANGIGKTTVLKIISDVFSDSRIVTRNAQCESGRYLIQVEHKHEKYEFKQEIRKFAPNERQYGPNYSECSKDLLKFNVERNFEYVSLSSISRDPERGINEITNIAANGVKAGDMKGWFINRFCFYDKEHSLSEEEKANFSCAKEMFSILDPSIKFKTVLAKSFDIILETPKGDIYFEYLSSGYKSCIYIIMDIMKEIEFRYGQAPIKIEDFEGCILIDEIEEHLHPSWQARLVKALKEIFPKCQFIITTHSPSILQNLTSDEIIPLYLNEKNETAIKPLELGRYGLQGWTLEEILTDVMGMPSTTSEVYKQTMAEFDKAMYEEDISKLTECYSVLKEMLHPRSVQRKLLEIQMAGLEA